MPVINPLCVAEIQPQLKDEFEEIKSNATEVLYQSHIPTTWFQKSLLAIGSGLAAFIDPKRDG